MGSTSKEPEDIINCPHTWTITWSKYSTIRDSKRLSTSSTLCHTRHPVSVSCVRVGEVRIEGKPKEWVFPEKLRQQIVSWIWRLWRIQVYFQISRVIALARTVVENFIRRLGYRNRKKMTNNTYSSLWKKGRYWKCTHIHFYESLDHCVVF